MAPVFKLLGIGILIIEQYNGQGKASILLEPLENCFLDPNGLAHPDVTEHSGIKWKGGFWKKKKKVLKRKLDSR